MDLVQRRDGAPDWVGVAAGAACTRGKLMLESCSPGLRARLVLGLQKDGA